jgi:hypothetical protein
MKNTLRTLGVNSGIAIIYKEVHLLRGTIREMLNNERRFNHENFGISLHKMVFTYFNDDMQEIIELARHVQLLNSMNNVHHFHILHYDMSSNNVLLHFLRNSLYKVYIGICN